MNEYLAALLASYFTEVLEKFVIFTKTHIASFIFTKTPIASLDIKKTSKKD